MLSQSVSCHVDQSSYFYWFKIWWSCAEVLYILGLCISITEADAIRISMHSQRNIEDTYEAASDAIRFTPITMQCDSIQHNAIRCNTMQLKKYDRFYFFGSDRQQIMN